MSNVELKTVINLATSEEAAYARTNEKIDSEIEGVNNRVDNIIVHGSSTAGNTELIDIRTGYDGNVYQLAGKAVRSQIEYLKLLHDRTEGQINLFNKEAFTPDCEYHVDTRQVIPNDKGYGLSELIPVTAGDVLFYSKDGTGFNVTFTYGFDISGNYVDGSRVAISDTYPSGDIYEVPSNLSSEQVSACMSMFSDVNPTEAFCRGTGTVTGLSGNQVTLVELIDELRLGTAYINYMLQTGLIQVIGENGTTEQWTNGRTVLTTAEWNSLASNPLSFKIKAESNEGIWTTTQIDSCIGCKFLYQDIDVEDSSTHLYTTWNYGGESGGYPVQVTPSTLTTGLYDNYLDLVNTTGKNYFLGVKLNSNNQPTNAYACGIKDGTPFCIEGSLYEGLGGTNTTAIYTRNSTTLRTQNVFGSACTIQIQSHPYEPRTVSTKCETSSLKAKAIDIGTVGVGLGNAVCLVNTTGYFGCTDDYPSGD